MVSPWRGDNAEEDNRGHHTLKGQQGRPYRARTTGDTTHREDNRGDNTQGRQQGTPHTLGTRQ